MIGASDLVGRDEDLDLLVAAADDAVRGHGSFVLVTGDAGIGKTRLVEALAARVAPELVVTWGRAWEEGAPPLWPWTQALRPLLADLDLVELVASGGSDRIELFDSVTEQLASVAAERAVLVILEDLHWADASSLALLEFAAREIRRLPVVVVGTCRDVELEAPLPRADRYVDLAGLDERDLAVVLAEATGTDPDPDLVNRIHARTGGNPLFTRELARLLPDAGGPSELATTLPEGIRSVLDRRLARVSQPCHELLQSASVLGVTFPIDELALLIDRDLPSALELVDEAVAARLVARDMQTGSFVHALVRDAAYEGLATSTRAELHHAAGILIEARYPDDLDRAAQLAHHFSRSARPADRDRAVTHARRAAHRATTLLAHEEAAAHSRAALALVGSDDPRGRLALLLESGEALVRAGDLPAARVLHGEAADLARRRSDPDGLARAALGLGAGRAGFEVALGDEQQIALLEEALAALPDEDSILRAWVLARLAVALSALGPDERRERLSAEAVAMTRRLGDPVALAYALASHCDAIAHPRFADTRTGEAGEIVALAEQTRERELELLGRRHRIVAAAECGDFAAFDQEVDAFARTAELIRQPLYAWYVPLYRGMRALMHGAPEGALALAARAAAVGREAHSANAVMLAEWSLPAAAYIELGDHERARRLVDLQVAQPAATRGIDIAPLFFAEFDPDGARRMLPVIRARLDTFPRDGLWLLILTAITGTIVAVDDREFVDLAEVITGELEPLADRWVLDGTASVAYGPVSYWLGLLARWLGRNEEADRYLVAALDACRRVGAPLVAARVERARGVGVRPTDPARFAREGETWAIDFHGEHTRLRDAKGLRDLGVLLARPGREIHVTELVATTERRGAVPPSGTTDTPLDDEARRRYEARLRELQDDIDAADDDGDAERSARAASELEFIAAELAGSLGLGARDRRPGDPNERARKAVGMRIRDAIARIEVECPALARHLRASVRTGLFCAYVPEHAVDWRL